MTKNITTTAQILTFILVLTTASVVLSKVTNSGKSLIILALYCLVFAVCYLGKLGLSDFGLSPKNLKAGVKLAAPFIFFIILCGTILFLFNSDIFADKRYQQSLVKLIFTVMISIPLATVLLEELIFRGILFSLLRKVMNIKYSIVFTSLAFGLWHLFSASLVSVSGLDLSFAIPKILIILGVVIATSLAGWFFLWLRIKSNSLLAPILVHWTINGTATVLAYFAWLTK